MSLDEWVQPNTTVDPEVRAYVGSLVTAVGGSSIEEHGRYVLGDDAIGCLKDLRRWIKFYDQKLNRLDVQRVLAEANFVKGDLLEILAGWLEKDTGGRLRFKVALLCVELLVPLTWSLELDDAEIAVHHHRHLPYLRLAQVGYKRAVLQHDSNKILRQVIRVALPSMAEARKERSPRDEGIIRLVLYFLRNVVMISQPTDLPADGDEVDISRSTTIDAFHHQDAFQFLLTIASSMGDEFDIQDVVVLEVLFHLLKGIDPDKLFMEDDQLVKSNTDELRELMRKEKAMHAGYARYAPTRHNRFGTMVWLKRDDERVSTISGQSAISGADKGLDRLDKTKKWNKPRYRGRKNEEKASTDFDMCVSLNPSARNHLRRFVEEFIDTSFNTIFGHLRKSIEREADRVLDTHRMQFFYLISWFLEAECARRRQARQAHSEKGKEKDGKACEADEDSFLIIAGVMNQESFVLLNRYMQEARDQKQWNNLNAGMKCFTQILLTVQQMSASSSEEDQEIAENIQNRIFYEETTHDRVVAILRSYKDQGFGFLDACTELAHVFIRMLEQYSKQNLDMQVRSRRRARRKKDPSKTGKGGNSQNDDGDDDDDGSGAEDAAHAERISRERKFDFARFSARFMTQHCVNTFVAYTRFYQDLSQEQLKRAHRFFYRVAFKTELSAVLFRVDIVQLFHVMIRGRESLDHDLPSFKEWEELVRQLFRKLIKRLQERPELMVEMLFSKIPSTLFYLEHGYEKEVVKSAPRPPAELEVSPRIAEGDRMGVLVGVLISEAKFDSLAWVKDVLEAAKVEREAWETAAAAAASSTPEAIQTDGERVENETADEIAAELPLPPSIFVKADDEDRRKQMFKDNKLRLLMKLGGFERLGVEDVPDASWIIPSSVTATELTRSIRLIEKFEMDPLSFDDEGASAENYLRRKSSAAAQQSSRRPEALASDSEGDDSFDDETLFPAGGPTARKSDTQKDSTRKKRRRNKVAPDPDDEEKVQMQEKRRQAELEKRRKIKSNLYVQDLDDETDDEKDAEFFRLEEERRKKTAGVHSLIITKGGSESNNKRKANQEDSKQTKRRQKTIDDDMSDDSGISKAGDENGDQETIAISSDSSSSDSKSDLDMESEHEAEDEDTPISSQHRAPSPSDSEVEAEKPSIFGPGRDDITMTAADNEGDDENKVPVKKTVRRNVRAGFVLDDSDDE